MRPAYRYSAKFAAGLLASFAGFGAAEEIVAIGYDTEMVVAVLVFAGVYEGLSAVLVGTDRRPLLSDPSPTRLIRGLGHITVFAVVAVGVLFALKTLGASGQLQYGVTIPGIGIEVTDESVVVTTIALTCYEGTRRGIDRITGRRNGSDPTEVPA